MNDLIIVCFITKNQGINVTIEKTNLSQAKIDVLFKTNSIFLKNYHYKVKETTYHVETNELNIFLEDI